MRGKIVNDWVLTSLIAIVSAIIGGVYVDYLHYSSFENFMGRLGSIIETYQTLITGVIALYAGLYAARPAFAQLRYNLLNDTIRDWSIVINYSKKATASQFPHDNSQLISYCKDRYSDVEKILDTITLLSTRFPNREFRRDLYTMKIMLVRLQNTFSAIENCPDLNCKRSSLEQSSIIIARQVIEKLNRLNATYKRIIRLETEEMHNTR